MLANAAKRKLSGSQRKLNQKNATSDSANSDSFRLKKTRIRRNVSFESLDSDDSSIPITNHPQAAPAAPPSAWPSSRLSASPRLAMEGRKVRQNLMTVTDRATNLTTRHISKATDAATGQLSKATELTTKQLSKATEHTTKQLGTALMQSEKAYKKSRWCFWARFIGRFPKYFPRVFSLTFGVLVPLWLLILISAGFGVLLANYEATEERISNHEILISRARINRTFIKRTDISQLPVDCYSQYLNHSNRSLFVEKIDAYVLATTSLEKLKYMNDMRNTDIGTPEDVGCSVPAVNLTDTNITDVNMTDTNFTKFNLTDTNFTDTNATRTNVTFVNESEMIPPPSPSNIFSNAFGNSTSVISDLIDNISPRDIDDALSAIILDSEDAVMLYMNQCQEEQNAEIEIYLDVRDKHRDASSEKLSFNWNRCWPKETNKVWAGTKFVFFPPPELIDSSHPSQQAAAVETEFVRVLDEAEKDCMDMGGEEEECFEQALGDASEAAGSICQDNVEGTSWFFFTIMTTVGYGNQTPITNEGRLLIYIAGVACLILFAGVLGSAGYIIMEIFDDFVSRFALSYFLQYPLVGVGLWGGIWIGWAYIIATDADIWWQQRLPDITVDVPDSLWFAFISTSTIGLGDYFLQPEVMFAGDALKFSIEYLIGFVFLSTFLNKIGEFIFTILPKRDGNLETRLRNTNLLFWKHWPCTDIEYLQPYIYEGSDKDLDKSVRQQQVLQYEQAKRVEMVKALVPNYSMPPRRGSITPLVVEEKSMEALLDEEEMMLKMLLESVEQRRRGHLGNTGESSPEAPRAKSIPEVDRHQLEANQDVRLSSIEEPPTDRNDHTDDDLLFSNRSSSTLSSLIEL